MTVPAIFPITTPPKPDTPYGKKGSNSLAARLASYIPDNHFTPDESTRYGEIWMGDHPSNPSSALFPDSKPQSLYELIAKDPLTYLGQAVYDKFKSTPSGTNDDAAGEGAHLPFVFKILSFDRALPLQTHPDRTLSARLKKEEKKESGKGENEEFLDTNYKPEVAVCVTPDGFEGFVGFRPVHEIQTFLAKVVELRAVVGDIAAVEELLNVSPKDDEQRIKRLVRDVFAGIIHMDDGTVGDAAERLLQRMEQFGEREVLGEYGVELGNVVKKCLKDYPGDKGMFVAVFLMNYVTLQKGEGVVVGVDELHAYLKGDIVECMAYGDNMLAHGFQPPEERSDADTFIKSASINPRPSTELVLPHQPWPKCKEGKTEQYQVPLDEFDLLNISLEKGESDGGKIDGPAVFLVVEGSAEIEGLDEKMKLEKGRSVFVRPGTEFKITAGDDGAEIWGSFTEV